MLCYKKKQTGERARMQTNKQTNISPLSQRILDVQRQLRRPHVRVHERRVRLHEQLVQRQDPLRQQPAYTAIRLVLANVPGDAEIEALLDVLDALLHRAGEGVDDHRRQTGGVLVQDLDQVVLGFLLVHEEWFP